MQILFGCVNFYSIKCSLAFSLFFLYLFLSQSCFFSSFKIFSDFFQTIRMFSAIFYGIFSQISIFVYSKVGSFRFFSLPDLKLGIDLKQKCFINHHHHHHVVPPARISRTLLRYPSLSSITPGRSSKLHPVLALSCCI